MMYQALVAFTVMLHFAFIGYVIAGGFLALRWRRTIWLHVLAVLWGLASVAGHVGCPLTGVERWARNQVRMPGLPSEGFIAHYITGVLYPAKWAGAVQIAVFVVVVASWTLYIWLYAWRRRHRRVQGAGRGTSGGVQ